MLAHQLPVCPPFEVFWTELPGSRLAGAEEIVVSPGNRANRCAYRSKRMRPAGPSDGDRLGISGTLETSACCREPLCVELGYQGSTRSIEPVLFAPHEANDLLLFAYER